MSRDGAGELGPSFGAAEGHAEAVVAARDLAERQASSSQDPTHEATLRPKLLGPVEVRELADRLGIMPTKKLGQNFVIDPNTVRKIVRLAKVEAGDRVVEIGPGLGSLTLGLTEAGASVTAVEIDHRLAAQLPKTLEAMQPMVAHSHEASAEAGTAANMAAVAPTVPDNRLRVVRADALDVGLGQLIDPDTWLMPEVLVANLPYNVSVPILMHLLELLPGLRSGLVMVQAEVGNRIAAPPGSKEYGSPSAKAAWYGAWHIAGTVSRRIFWPIPGVDSNLVSFTRAEERLGTEAERVATFELVNAAFAVRRKMLRQSLQGVLGIPQSADGASEVIAAAGIDPTLRAEQLNIEQFLAIARSVTME